MAENALDVGLVDEPEKLGMDEEGEIPELGPYALTEENQKKISSRIDKKLGVDKFSRSQFERAWFRNVAFFAGLQDLIVDRGKFRLKEVPAWYPKAQTNKFKEKARDLLSAVLQGRVPIRYFPATEDPSSAATAEIGERVRDVIYTEAKIDLKENELASWFVITGNAFLVPYYDYDEKFGMMEHPKLGCANCGTTYGAGEMQDLDEDNPTCPTCAPELAEMGQDPSMLQQSEETEMLPIGSLCADVCSPFEIRGDSRIRDFKEWKWFVRQRRYDVSFAKEKWQYEGSTGEREEPGGSLSQHYLDVLSQINANFDPRDSTMSSSSGESKNPKVTAYEYYQLPDEDYPEGVRAVRLGSGSQNVVELGPLASEYGAGIKQGQKFLPIIHFRAEVVPGRLWGDTPLNEAIPLQLFRNVVERVIKLETQRMANSVWLDPKGSGVAQYTAGPGQVVTYNPLTLGGTTPVKPERLPPQLAHLGMLIELLKFIDDAIERVTGTFFLQGGDAPSGVTAASALALLDERAKKAMSPLVREWAKGFLVFDELALELARQHWTDTRIRLVSGRNKKWETQKFMTSDLQGAVTMEIDYQSMFPKSNATEIAQITQLIQGMVLNPADPEQKMQILKKFGMMYMLGSYDLDVKQAQKEQERFLESGGQMVPELVPLVQNSLVHFMQHSDFAKTDEFDELPPEVKQLWYAHITAHASDMGERRALFSMMGIDPDNPQSQEIGTGAAQAGIGGAQQVMGKPGSQRGSGGPNKPQPGKGTTGNGPNQAQAQQAIQEGIGG
jgi:hypothetical protein